MSKFHSTPVVFEIPPSLRQVHQMNPKWHWTLRGQVHPLYVLLLPKSPKFQSLSVTGHFGTSATNDPKMTLNTTRSKILHIYVISISASISVLLLYDEPFSRPRTFYISSLTTMLNGRDPPQEYTWNLGSKSGVYFQRRCRLKLLIPYVPMLTGTEKKGRK